MSSASGFIALKKAHELQKKFVDKGAISPSTAMTLEEIGINIKSGIFELMTLKNHIIEVGSKYYFDNDKFDDRAVKKLKNFITSLFNESNE